MREGNWGGGGGRHTSYFVTKFSILTKLSLSTGVYVESLEAMQTFFTSEWNIISGKKMDLLCLDAN